MADALAASDRSLPHNLEAERSVLGAILLHNEAFNARGRGLDSRDFFRDAHRRIFDKMVRARRAGRRDRPGHPQGGAGRGGRARRGGRPGLHRRARRRRAALDQRRALRPDHQGEGHPPEPDLLGEQDPRYGVRGRGGGRPDPRPGRAARSSRSPTTACATASSRCARWPRPASRRSRSSTPTSELITGVPTGFTDLDEMTSGLAAVRPHHHRGPAVDGEDRAWP